MLQNILNHKTLMETFLLIGITIVAAHMDYTKRKQETQEHQQTAQIQ